MVPSIDEIQDMLLSDPRWLAGACILALATWRYAYLALQRPTTRTHTTRNALGAYTNAVPLATPLRKPWWPSRTQRLAEQTALVRTETDLLLSRVENARAKGTLARVHEELDAILAEARVRRMPVQPAPAPAAPPSPALTAREIAELIDSLDELDPAIRETLLALVAARLEERTP